MFSCVMLAFRQDLARDGEWDGPSLCTHIHARTHTQIWDVALDNIGIRVGSEIGQEQVGGGKQAA